MTPYMTTADNRLRAAAEAWATAYKRRIEATSLKRRTFAAYRAGATFDGSFLADMDAARRVTEARAGLRAAEKALLAIVDPKPITLKAKAREVKPGHTLLIDRVLPPYDDSQSTRTP
ncbi:hypothetical protein QTI17_01320 [Variovorax sp. J31P179]|uniref:hypothetical protein n=1 Tax=Variovorax sp. J31P179 TaxID=3053508 RepID=UPI002578396E|nr:hypothetical protein [Variovorax sp. J31P179]MDM0079221.1 hypothetical protein [Variovorax sp. J31P179]